MADRSQVHHRGNASVTGLLVCVLLVSVATLILVYQMRQEHEGDTDTPAPQPAKQNDTGEVTSKEQKTDGTQIKPVTHFADRSPLAQPGEVIEKPIAPVVLPVAADLKATAPEPKQGEVVPWSKAREHIGRTITVEGKVLQTNNIGSICFLNFTNEPRGGDKFYMVVFRDAFDLFGGKPEVYFKGKTVRVTGKVEDHKGRPQMKIRKKEQVVVIKPQ